MNKIMRKLGMVLMASAAFTVAGHIFQHCVGNEANTLVTCSVCQSIHGASAHAAAPAVAEFVFLREAAFLLLPGYSFSPVRLERSRAPPVLFS